jgi:hypothetical protein
MPLTFWLNLNCARCGPVSKRNAEDVTEGPPTTSLSRIASVALDVVPIS